jgi:hypothetical protein
MKKLHTVILLIILACVATVFASVAISLTVQSQGDNANLNWSVSGINLSDQQRFSIQRKTPQTDYQEIAAVTASSSSSFYQYTDKAVYKTADVMYVYRIRLVDVNNPNYVYGSSDEVHISLSISGVKKTWGSIKAMFR